MMYIVVVVLYKNLAQKTGPILLKFKQNLRFINGCTKIFFDRSIKSRTQRWPKIQIMQSLYWLFCKEWALELNLKIRDRSRCN